MKNTLTVSFISLCAACAAISLIASPAATQNWVKDYVSTNVSGGVSREWVQDYVASNSVSPAVTAQISTNATLSLARATDTAIQILMDGGSNSVGRACQSLNTDAAAIVNTIMNDTMGL